MLAGEENSSAILKSNIERFENVIASRMNDLAKTNAENENIMNHIEREELLLSKNIRSREFAN